MSKKLLVLLIAASACCALGCGDDDSSCGTGEKRCDGNKLNVCVLGKWVSQECANGCDAAKGMCKAEGSSTGEDCAPGGADKNCKAACKSDGTEGYYWKGDKVETVKCEDDKKCKVDGNQVSCVEKGAAECEDGKSECTDADTSRLCFFGQWLPTPCDGGCDSTTGMCVDKDCTATSKGLCNPACNADKTEGYRWQAATGKVETVRCDGGKTCSITQDSFGGTDVVCGSGSDGGCTGDIVTTGGEVGNCCNSETYQQTCTDGNAHALVCWSGKVTQWDCADNDCKPNSEKPNQVICKKADNTSCTAESTAKCDAACSADEAKAYYWDGKNNKLVTMDCAADGDKCVKEGTRVSCRTPSTGEACDPTKDMPTCGSDDTVKYCRNDDKEFVVKKDCPQCHVDGDTFFCNGDHLLQDCTKDSAEKCRGACDADDPTRGWRWDINGNKLVEWTCKTGETCSASKTGWFSCVKAQ